LRDLYRSRSHRAVSVVSAQSVQHSGFWMCCRSGPSRWLPKQPSALN